MNKQQYYVLRCFRDFNGFYKLCKQIKCLYYYKKTMRHTFGTLTYREAWLTPEQFTFFNLLTDQPHYTECMIETHRAPNEYDDNVDLEIGRAHV